MKNSIIFLKISFLAFLFFLFLFDPQLVSKALAQCACSPVQSGQCSDEAAQLTCDYFQTNYCDNTSNPLYSSCGPSTSVCSNSGSSGFICCCQSISDPIPLPTPTPTPTPVPPTPTPTPTPPPAGCQYDWQCGSCRRCCEDSPNYCSSLNYDCAWNLICVTPTPTPAGCPAMTCSWSQSDPGCASGVTICTGTGTSGFNQPGCTWVTGCSSCSCYSGGPTPTPGGGGPTCYTVDCWNNSEGTRCYVGEQYLSSASCSWNQCKSWNPSEYPQCRGNDGSCTVTGGCGGPGPGPSAPDCDPNQVNMSVSPNPVPINNSITFSVSGSQGSTNIVDTWSGGVDCSGPFWGSKTCNATTVGSYTWTHSWQNCAPSNCDILSPLCSKTAPFTVIGYTISGSVFVDSNKNRVKDSGEQNYTDSITITSAGGIVTTLAGSYTISNLPDGPYTVSYDGPPQGHELTYLNGASVTVGTACSTNGFEGANCVSGNIENLNFGITSDFPWFQGKGGDMRLDNGFTDPVPTDLSTYASLEGTGETPGVIFSGDGSYNFCPGNSIGTCQDRASTTEWVVGGFTNPEVFTPVHSGIIRTSYEYIKTTARQSGLTPTDLPSDCNNSSGCSLSGLTHGLYRNSNADESIDDANIHVYFNDSTFSGGNYVLLIRGNLHLLGTIDVSPGSTLTFSVSGDIVVDKDVGTSTFSSTVPNIEGFYSTDGSFIINSYGAEDGVICNLNGTPRDKRLNMQGSIVVNAALTAVPGVDSFQNQRDLCTSSDFPAFYIEERPDFFLNAPELIKHPNFTWQEVAP